MRAGLRTPETPGFWRTVSLLLGAARRRAIGRRNRQRDLLYHRTGKRKDTIGELGAMAVVIGMAVLNGGAAFVVQSAVSTGQRLEAEHGGKIIVSRRFLEVLKETEKPGPEFSKQPARKLLEDIYSSEARYRSREVGGSEEENEKLLRDAVRTRGSNDFITEASAEPGIRGLAATGSFPAMLGFIGLLWWFVMLIFQGEGLELDVQRQRHPMWEWLFSHPVSPGAIFLAEMLSPIAANPIYLTAPLFCGFLYGSIYGAAAGMGAAILIGVPISVATACVGKAFEIGIMLRFPPRSRGAVIGFMSWAGYASMMGFVVGAFAMPTIVRTVGEPLRRVAILVPWPWLGWFVGAQSDGSFSFISGTITCWLVAIVMIAGGVWYSVWGAQRGLTGNTTRAALKAPVSETARKPRFGHNPLYQKELLWFVRDRSAIVQTILIPLTVAGFQLFNLRGILRDAQSEWNYLAGAAIVFGTYFLWILGPRSLASEGPALWLALTWPRGLEGLLKSKARLWSLISTGLVSLILGYAIFRFPRDAWKVMLVGIGWLAFGRGMAEKAVTLVSAPSSSGEPERVPKGRQWAASLGMLTFGIGILTQRWHLAVMGVVYSWVTAAAMWQNFRARLPFLYDPWSEKPPHPPTIMHAMIAISVLVDGGAVATGLFVLLVGLENIAVAQPIAYGLCAGAVTIFVSRFLAGRGIRLSDVLCWPSSVNTDKASQPWWRGGGTAKGRLLVSLGIGGLAGLALGLLGQSYIAFMLHFPNIAEMIRKSQEEMTRVPGLKASYGFIAVALAPFAEEYLFRGLLFRALDREWGGWRAVAASAAFFAIYHPPLAWLPVGILGVANALVFKKTGRLAPAVILHMTYNVVVLS